MDLLRFDTADFGPVYVRPDQLVSLGKIDEASCNVGILYPNGKGVDLKINSDVDEVAQSIERAVPGCRIHRII